MGRPSARILAIVAFACAVVASAGCGDDDGSGAPPDLASALPDLGPLACGQTLDEYCAGAGAGTCFRTVDANNDSMWCPDGGVPAANAKGLCASSDFLIDAYGVVFDYRASQLVAVLALHPGPTFTCIAGPGYFDPPLSCELNVRITCGG